MQKYTFSADISETKVFFAKETKLGYRDRAILHCTARHDIKVIYSSSLSTCDYDVDKQKELVKIIYIVIDVFKVQKRTREKHMRSDHFLFSFYILDFNDILL